MEDSKIVLLPDFYTLLHNGFLGNDDRHNIKGKPNKLINQRKKTKLDKSQKLFVPKADPSMTPFHLRLRDLMNG